MALVLILAPAVFGQQSANQAAATGSIAGEVVKSTTGQPLKRALVTAQWTGRRQASFEPMQRVTRTDSTGQFILHNLPPGEYNLWVNRDGYLSQAYGQDTPNNPGRVLKLGPGETKGGLVFRLVPTGAVIGRVYDEDGEPISGVSVQALRTAYSNGVRELNIVAGSTTNDLGEYRLIGLAAGKYYVGATYTESDPGDDTTSEAYAPVYYPGTNEPTGALPVEVQPGDETPVDFNLIPVPAVHVRGRILSSDASKPAGGVSIMLMRRGAWSFFQSQTYVDPRQGTFEIRNVPPGSYFIIAQANDGRGRPSYARQLLEVGDADIDGVTLAPGPGLEIRGQLRVEGKSQLKFTDGPNQVDLTGAQISLQPRGPMPFGVQPTQVSPDGSFVLKEVPPGNYVVNVCCLPYDLYLRAAHFGSADALGAGLTVDQSQSSGSLDLVIGTSGGHIDGVVMSDQKPASAVTVVLAPDANRRDQTRLYLTALTDQRGRFSIGSIPPGDYTLFAWSKVENGAFYDPDFLSTYEKGGKSLTVDEASNLNVQLELIAPASQ